MHPLSPSVAGCGGRSQVASAVRASGPPAGQIGGRSVLRRRSWPVVGESAKLRRFCNGAAWAGDGDVIRLLLPSSQPSAPAVGLVPTGRGEEAGLQPTTQAMRP
jgi:hypothetical protein